MTQETSTSVNTLTRLDNNEHHINQKLVLTRAYSFNSVLLAGKIAPVCGLLKEKYFLQISCS